jgi:hypothetical protein
VRRWVLLAVIALTVGAAALSASEHEAYDADRGVYVDADRYAAEGGESEAEMEAEEEAASSPGTFTGSFAPPSTCGENTFLVEAGTETIDVVVSANLPTNDITLSLVDPTGTPVADTDTLTSPEVIHYSSSTIAAGTWTVRVCPASNGAAFLPPYDYTGTFTTSTASVPTVPVLPVVNAGTPTPTFGAGRLTFAPETIIDPQRTEGEPVNFFAQDGTYWESGPFGTSTQQSWVHRSTDNGLSFHLVSGIGLRPDAPPGGGDTDVVLDDQNYAYFSDLEALVNVGTSVSNDGGNTWRKNTLGAQEVGVDRQWYAVDNGPTAAASDNTVFLVYRQTPAGSQILSSPGSTGPSDPVGGLVWTNAASAAGLLAISNGAPCGKLVFDPVKRNLYLPCGKGDHIEVAVGHVNPGQRTNIEFHTVQLQPAPPKGDPTTVFPWLGVDAAGNLMVIWIDGTDRNVYASVSTDQGASWTTPLKVNTPPSVTNVFPQVVGGAAGTFVLTWYGSESSLDSDHQPPNAAPNSSDFPWYGYVAVVTRADTLQPTVAQQRFTSHPMHYGQVCNSGTTCTSGRTMADYFDVGIDRQGAIRIVFDDESSQYRQAHLMEVRQIGGASPKGGNVKGNAPVNPSDAAGDAQVPHYGATGAGASRAGLDFTKLALSVPAKGILRVQMTVADAADLAPPTGKSSIVWLTRFQARSVMPNGAEAYRIFFVGAKSTNGGKLTYFAGSGDDPTGCLDASTSGCKIVFYPAEQTLTSGGVTKNTIRIDVSLQNGFGSGRPISGSTLYSVTALSYGENADEDLYLDADATPSFDYQLGGVPPAVPQPTS